MGCATSTPCVTVPPTHQHQALRLSSKDVPTLSKLAAPHSCSSSASSSSSLSCSSRRKRQFSGLEGRHGFVQPRCRASFDVGTPTRRASMEASKASPNRRQSLQVARPGTNNRRSMTLSMGTLGEAGEHEEDSRDDVDIDVPFLLKKALELQLGYLMTRHNLEHIVQVVSSDLDPNQLGTISAQSVVLYVQSACTAAHLVQPTCQQLQAALPTLPLGRHSTIATTALREALLSLEWPLLNTTIGTSQHTGQMPTLHAQLGLRTVQPNGATAVPPPSSGSATTGWSLTASDQHGAAIRAIAS